MKVGWVYKKGKDNYICMQFVKESEVSKNLKGIKTKGYFCNMYTGCDIIFQEFYRTKEDFLKVYTEVGKLSVIIRKGLKYILQNGS